MPVKPFNGFQQQRRKSKGGGEREIKWEISSSTHNLARVSTHRNTHKIPFQLDSVCLFDPWCRMHAKLTQTKALNWRLHKPV